MNITIGTDPELFVQNEAEEVVTAIGVIGGSKSKPRPVDKGAVQEDNVLAEFNTAPSSTAEEFVSTINDVIGQLSDIVGKAGLTLLRKASHEYEYMSLIEAGPAALEFGCDPDFNAWIMDANPAPRPADGLRTAGGHVHIGYDNPDDMTSVMIARACDYLLGLPSVLLDDDDRRRQVYGAAGAFRLKEYGVEYRTLSNFWLESDNLMRWVYEQAQASVYAASELDKYTDVVSGDEVQRIINTGDKEAAAAAIEQLGIDMP